MSKRLLPTLIALIAAVFLVPSVALAQSSASRSQDVIEKAQTQANQLAESASDKAAQIQNKAESVSLKVRQEVCEQKRVRLQTLTQKMYQGADSVKKNLDTIYQRVVEFYDKGQLTVTNYQQYIDKIELAKQEATTAMTALQQRENSNIDCASAKTATRLEGDRLAGQGAKTALKEYRKELVAFISALKSAAATEEMSNE